MTMTSKEFENVYKSVCHQYRDDACNTEYLIMVREGYEKMMLADDEETFEEGKKDIIEGIEGLGCNHPSDCDCDACQIYQFAENSVFEG